MADKSVVALRSLLPAAGALRSPLVVAGGRHYEDARGLFNSAVTGHLATKCSRRVILLASTSHRNGASESPCGKELESQVTLTCAVVPNLNHLLGVEERYRW
jgi:hypothetical protein